MSYTSFDLFERKNVMLAKDMGSFLAFIQTAVTDNSR